MYYVLSITLFLQREAQVPTGAVDVNVDVGVDLDLERNEDFRDANSFATKSLLRDKVIQKYNKEGKRLPDIDPPPRPATQQEVGWHWQCLVDFLYIYIMSKLLLVFGYEPRCPRIDMPTH